MTIPSAQDKEFLDQLIAKVESNISEEEFGVSELACAMNMSRSNLLRRVKKASNLSVSQLISQIRLERAMSLLRNSTLNVSEVSHQVGFNSPSYFIKCFREHYGYPPGEAAKHVEAPAPEVSISAKSFSQKKYWIAGVTLVFLLSVAGLVFISDFFAAKVNREKSIVVLPFKNDSGDSTNIYLINGLMDATLNNLQKIKDLRVLSRTSAEKYRATDKSAPEIAEELKVSYLIEGSGQKIDGRIVLNIQLIEGATDKHLWSKQYRREANDIFTLQQEISKDIAQRIQVIITPEEQDRIDKIPTESLKAYDSFLKGLELLNSPAGSLGGEHLSESVVYFDQAIQEDESFALAYACAGMAFYYLDLYQTEMPHLEKLGAYSDKAMLYDAASAESHTVKAMYYLLKRDYSQALPFLEKGLEFKPNSSQIIGLLGDFYANHLPNTEKYLEYALRGMSLDVGGMDSVAASYFYLRLGNALVQTGFVDEAMENIDMSLAYFAGNAFSRYVKAFVNYAKTNDLERTREMLIEEFARDTTRFDILQDVGKVSYYLRDYDSAYFYYEKFNRIREEQKLNVYVHENQIIGEVYEKVGKKAEAEAFFKSYWEYIQKDQTIYKNLGLAMHYAHRRDFETALEHLRLFAKEDNIQVWVVLFLPQDPMVEEFKKLPEFQKIWEEIERKFWAKHRIIREKLAEEELL